MDYLGVTFSNKSFFIKNIEKDKADKIRKLNFNMIFYFELLDGLSTIKDNTFYIIDLNTNKFIFLREEVIFRNYTKEIEYLI